MNKAYFKGIKNKITELLHSAKDEVLVAVAWFTQESLIEELIDCVNRGVKVKVLMLDDPYNRAYAEYFNKFIKFGGSLYIANRTMGLMHHKFCVVDNTNIITGSYNWTHYAEDRNIENVVVSDDNDLCESYRNEFINLIEGLTKMTEIIKSSEDEIRNYQNNNFEGLDYEYDVISYKKIIPVTTQNVRCQQPTLIKKVQIVDPVKTYTSNYDIGVVAKGDWHTFIAKGSTLPCSSSQSAYLEKNENNEYRCDVYSRNDDDDNCSLILSTSINQIAATSNPKAQIAINISLDKNGYIRVEITDESTKKQLIGGDTNETLVTGE